MKPYTLPLVAFLLLLSTGCQSGGGARPSAAPPEARELRQLAVEWDRLFNQGDAAKLAALYAPDCVSMPPGAPTIQGRKALQEEFQTFFSANSARHESTVEDVLIDGGLAVERARYRLTFRPRAGGAETNETSRHIEVRRKIDGRWLIVWELWNTDAPATPATPATGTP